MTEQIIDPALEIVDPHHHLWDHPGNRYLLEELRSDTGSGHNVVQTVFVECASAYRTDGDEAFRPVGETEFVRAEAERSSASAGAIIAAIVGMADLTRPEVSEVLAAHVEAGGGLFRGVRHVNAHDESPDVRASHTDPPPQLLGRPEFRRGFAALGAAGLRFDAWMYHPQLPELVDLCRAHPEVPVILDHLGGPLGIGRFAGDRERWLPDWRSSMAEVATCPNVVLKVGGIGMPVFGIGWHKRPERVSSEELAAAWGDDIRLCIDTFGPQRCMFESNFPVDRAGVDYPVLWNTFKRVSEDYSPAERADLFRGTARRAYALPGL